MKTLSLSEFIGKSQLAAMKAGKRGEERQFFIEKEKEIIDLN